MHACKRAGRGGGSCAGRGLGRGSRVLPGQEGGGGFLYGKGSRKGFLGYFMGRKGGGFLCRKGSSCTACHHIPSARHGMSTILLLPSLLLIPPYTQAVPQIAFAPPVDRLQIQGKGWTTFWHAHQKACPSATLVLQMIALAASSKLGSTGLGFGWP